MNQKFSPVSAGVPSGHPPVAAVNKPAQGGIKTKEITLPDLKVPAATLADKILGVVSELLPPDFNSKPGCYERTMKVVKARLSEPGNDWLNIKTSADREDVIPGHCLPLLQSLLEEGKKLACAGGAGKSLIAKVLKQVAEVSDVANRRLEEVDKAISQQESLANPSGPLKIVEDFGSGGVRPLDWFDEMKGSIPDELRSDVETALTRFGRPDGFLYRFGLKNVEKERDRVCRKVVSGWLKTQKALMENSSVRLKELGRDREEAESKILQVNNNRPKIYLAYLKSARDELVSSAFGLPSLEAIQSMGKEYAAFRADEDKLKKVFNSALEIADALETGKEELEPLFTKFTEAHRTFRKDEESVLHVKKSVEAAETEMAGCVTAVSLDRLSQELRKNKESLCKSQEAMTKSEALLDAAAGELGKALFREAKSRVLSGQEVSKDAVRLLRNLCDTLMPGAVGDKYGEAIQAILKAHEETVGILEKACHNAVSRWLRQDAEVLLRSFIFEAWKVERQEMPQTWQNLLARSDKPVILDMEELQKRKAAGRNSVVITTKFESGDFSSPAWRLDTSEWFTCVPNVMLFPTLIYSSSMMHFRYSERSAPFSSSFWLPLGDSCDKEALGAAFQGFLAVCEKNKNDKLQLKIDFNLLP